MKQYRYLTESFDCGLSRKKLVERLDELLRKRSREGWRLVKYDFSDFLNACVVVFEKEIGSEGENHVQES